MIKKNKENTLRILLFIFLLLSFLSFFGAVVNGTLDNRLFFNSDALSHPTIYKDIFEDGFDFDGWMFADSPSFFPDFLVYILIKLFSPNFKLATVFTAVLLFAFIFGGLYLLFGLFSKNTFS